LPGWWWLFDRWARVFDGAFLMASVVISRLTSPTSDQLSFTGLTLTGYRLVTLHVWGVTVGTDDASVWLRVSQSGSFLSGASDYTYVTVSRSTGGSNENEVSAAAAQIALSDDTANWSVGNAAGESFVTRIEVVNRESGDPCYVTFNGAHTGPTGNSVMVNGQGIVKNSTAIDGLRILLSTGTMPTGKAVLIGHT
jgi:hypothetical protein